MKESSQEQITEEGEHFEEPVEFHDDPMPEGSDLSDNNDMGLMI